VLFKVGMVNHWGVHVRPPVAHVYHRAKGAICGTVHCASGVHVSSKSRIDN
jgi:hypothetical protein